MKRTIASLILTLAVASTISASDAGSYLAAPNASASPRPSHAIARIWHGRTVASKADAYEKYLNDEGVAKLKKVPGNLGVEVLRRNQGGVSDFIVISYWTSLDAVKNYAGSDYAKVKPLARDREFLMDPEPEVAHYEVVRSGAR